jgi:hypothetical protein
MAWEAPSRVRDIGEAAEKFWITPWLTRTSATRMA